MITNSFHEGGRQARLYIQIAGRPLQNNLLNVDNVILILTRATAFIGSPFKNVLLK